MSSIAVIITNYNRRSNLQFTLRALQEQTAKDFYVLIADDGSTDGSREDVLQLMSTPFWCGRLQLLSGGPHQGARIAQLRNLALANVPQESTYAVILDADICLAPDAIEKIAAYHAASPEAVMINRLDWLPPMGPEAIAQCWDEDGFSGLLAHIPDYRMRLYRHTPVGSEFRDLPRALTPVPLDYQLFHPVYGLSLALFWRTGGFDEAMTNYGLHEHEYAFRMAKAGAQMIVAPEVRAVHIWHPKDSTVEQYVHWQRQRNMAYFLSKHGPQPYIMGGRDWKYWKHYNSETGSRVVSIGTNNERSLYVVNAENTYRLRLATEAWLFPLGFRNKDIQAIEQHELDQIGDDGEAIDYLGEIAFPSDMPRPRPAIELASKRTPRVARQNDFSSFRLYDLLWRYDIERTRFDGMWWASIPVIGGVLKAISRLIWSGRVWARESMVLQAMVEQITEAPDAKRDSRTEN